MAIGIRKKGEAPPHDDDLVHRLASCHARIRAALAEARALAEGSGSVEARRASAAAVARYFRHALPLHAEDEDRLLAPHLPETAAGLLARLAREHGEIDAQLLVLLPVWTRWAEGRTDPAPHDHARHVARVSDALAAHLALEEVELFPLVAAIPVVLARQLGAAMQLRRHLPEDAVYRFEGIDASLTLVPLAGRRALDAAGRKVGLEAWRAMPREARRSIVDAGGAERVGVQAVRAALDGVETRRVEGRPDPDLAHVPGVVRAALASFLELDDVRWSALRSLDRWAFASLAERGRFEGLRALAEELGLISPPPPAG
jgi:hemerythrin-like domain-containing protein